MNRDTKYFINITLAVIGFMTVFGNANIIDAKVLYIITILNNTLQ